jgi:hypothetical protein
VLEAIFCQRFALRAKAVSSSEPAAGIRKGTTNDPSHGTIFERMMPRGGTGH